MSPAAKLLFMRNVRILSVALDPPEETDDRRQANRDAVLAALDVAKGYDPDFVCFPEIVLQERAGADRDTASEVVARRIELAEPVPGPATDAVGARAAELDCFVVLPTLEYTDDAVYNTAVLVAPDGEVAGRYRKLRPPLTELDPGVTPGDKVAVWDTPFGRVGAVVCFDLMYPDIGMELARERADLVFFPSQFDGGRRLQSWARDYGFHFVKSTTNSAEVVTPTGNAVTRTDDRFPPSWVDLGGGAKAQFGFAAINADCATYAKATSQEAVVRIQEEVGGVAVTEMSLEGQIVVESCSPDASIEDLEAEYDLERTVDYLDRTEAAGRASRSAVSDGGPK